MDTLVGPDGTSGGDNTPEMAKNLTFEPGTLSIFQVWSILYLNYYKNEFQSTVGAKWSDWRHFDILNFREVNVFIGLRNVKETKTGLLLCFVSQLDLIRKIRLRFKKCFGEDRFNKSIIQTKPWIKLRLKKWMFFEMFQFSPSYCEDIKTTNLRKIFWIRFPSYNNTIL